MNEAGSGFPVNQGDLWHYSLKESSKIGKTDKDALQSGSQKMGIQGFCHSAVQRTLKYSTIVLIAIAGSLQSIPAHADALFDTKTLRSLAPLFERAECAQHCESAAWNINGQAFPKGTERSLSAQDALFTLSEKGCSSRGCVEAYVLRDATHLVILKDGYAPIRRAPLAASDIPTDGERAQLPRTPRARNELQPARAQADAVVSSLANVANNTHTTNQAYAACPQSFSSQSASTLACYCRTNPAGNIWGTDVYTNDSNICVAAVHSGVIMSSAGGLVTVKALPGQSKYEGSQRNAVRSGSYGPWTESFTVSKPVDAEKAVPLERAVTADPMVEVAKTVRPEDPINVVARGLDTTKKYWVTVVKTGAPHGGYTDYKDIKGTDHAELSLNARRAGAYEVRLHDYANGYPLVASAPFEVRDASAKSENVLGSNADPTVIADSDASVTGNAGILRQSFPGVFKTIEEYPFPSALNQSTLKAAATESIETSLLFLLKIQSNSHAQALGISAESFADMFTAEPAAALDLVAQDVLLSTGKALFKGYVAKLITNSIFSREPYASLPSELKAPLEALVEATFKEGLGLTMTPADAGPSVLVGPILSRVIDVYEIYQATNALAKTQHLGLLAVAFGADINAELAVRYPSDRTDALIRQWQTDTRHNLNGIVGADDALEVWEIVTLGYSALLSAARGETEEAARTIDQMVALGQKGDGPFLFSAEGPIDMLVKIAAGGDAPKKAAQTFVTATKLSEVVKAGYTKQALEGLPKGDWGERPSTINAIVEILQNIPVKKARDCTKSYGPLTQELSESLLLNTRITVRSQRKSFQKVVTGWMIKSDGFCFDYTPLYCGKLYYCASGESVFSWGQSQIVAVDSPPEIAAINNVIRRDITTSKNRKLEVKGRECYLYQSGAVATFEGAAMLPDSVAWNGECSNSLVEGAGAITWFKGETMLSRTLVGPRWDTFLSKGEYRIEVDPNNFAFKLQECRDSPTPLVPFRPVRRVEVRPIDQSRKEILDAYFANAFITEELLKIAAQVAMSYCPVGEFGFDNIEVKLFSHLDLHRPVVLATSAGTKELKWAEIDNRAIKEMNADFLGFERTRVATEQKRAEEEQRKREGAELEREIEALRQRARRLLDTGAGTPEELAIALQIDEKRTLKVLEDGLKLELQPVPGVSTVNTGGTKYYAVVYKPASLIAATIEKRRLARMNRSFSWADWFDQTSFQGAERKLEITCLYPDVSDIPDRAKLVKTKLKSFNSQGRDAAVVLECNFSWLDRVF